MTILEARRWILRPFAYRGRSVGDLATNQLQYALQFFVLDSDEMTAVTMVMRERDKEEPPVSQVPERTYRRSLG